MKLTLVGYDYCPFIQPLIILLNEKKADFSVTYLESGNKPAWVDEVSPSGASPFLYTDGKALFESLAIAEYLEEAVPGSLFPADPFTKAQNRFWIIRSYDLLDHIYTIKTTDRTDIVTAEVALLTRSLSDLESAISEGPFFNGGLFSLVDCIYAPVFRAINILDNSFSTGILDSLPLLKCWSDKVLSRASVQSSVKPDFNNKMIAAISSSDAALLIPRASTESIDSYE